MNELVQTLTVLGKPYSVTRSRIGAITKVYKEQFLCDLPAVQELCEAVAEKISTVPLLEGVSFSFLISYSDQTHHDGDISILRDLKSKTLPTGKQTERVVMRWVATHKFDGVDNELAITVRIANPVNPLIFLQAALSKSANDLDNMEFEMGFTCVTVDGAGQPFAEEIFLRIKNWIDARNKPYAYLGIHDSYLKHEWVLGQANFSLLPMLIVSAAALYLHKHTDTAAQLAAVPILTSSFFVLRTFAGRLNTKMAKWAKKGMFVSLFQITNGDRDALTKLNASAKNGSIKLVVGGVVTVALNVLSALLTYFIFKI